VTDGAPSGTAAMIAGFIPNATLPWCNF